MPGDRTMGGRVVPGPGVAPVRTVHVPRAQQKTAGIAPGRSILSQVNDESLDSQFPEHCIGIHVPGTGEAGNNLCHTGNSAHGQNFGMGLCGDCGGDPFPVQGWIQLEQCIHQCPADGITTTIPGTGRSVPMAIQ